MGLGDIMGLTPGYDREQQYMQSMPEGRMGMGWVLMGDIRGGVKERSGWG